MYKIMLVEDDANLRAIYGDRLLAEGFEIVSAKDGEEGLAMAVKEKPDLIISDVMMPKISGFDMLDILRTTPETKNTKVIMMTALSQGEDKERADKLGADKYLVKSQVTLEDVARVVHEVLGDQPAPEPAAAPSAALTPATPAPTVATTATEPAQNTPFSSQVPAPAPVVGVQPASPPAPALAPEPTTSLPATPSPVIAAAPIAAQAAAAPSTPPFLVTEVPGGLNDESYDPLQPAPTPEPMQQPFGESSIAKKVVQPLTENFGNAAPKIYELYEKEMADQAQATVTQPVIAPTPAPQMATLPPQPAYQPQAAVQLSPVSPQPVIQPASAPTIQPQPVVQEPTQQVAPAPQPGPVSPGQTIDPNSVAL